MQHGNQQPLLQQNHPWTLSVFNENANAPTSLNMSPALLCADCLFSDLVGEEGPVVAANAESTAYFDGCDVAASESIHSGLILIVSGSDSSILLERVTFEDTSGHQLSMPHQDDGIFLADEALPVYYESGHVQGKALIAGGSSRDLFASPNNQTYIALRQVRCQCFSAAVASWALTF